MEINGFDKQKFTKDQLEQIDHVHEVAYKAMCELVGDELEEDMDWIKEVSIALAKISYTKLGYCPIELYPYIGEM